MRARRVLVVARNETAATILARWLGEWHDVMFVTSFPEAKQELLRRPHLLITELKLGEYNGLHLALRSRCAGIPAIVLGPADSGFADEAERLGASYVAGSVAAGDLHDLVDGLIEQMPGDDRDDDLGDVSWSDDLGWPGASVDPDRPPQRKAFIH